MSKPRNPYTVFTDEWHAWKEQHDNWHPYHVGTTPDGAPCPSGFVRCVKNSKTGWRCPDRRCGKVFPTYTSEVGAVPLTGGPLRLQPLVDANAAGCTLTFLNAEGEVIDG